jgi:hypothetical protein
MHEPIFAILALVLSAIATTSVAQGTGQETLSADPRTRCAELVASWQRHGGSKSEGGGGGDIARKNAEVDCAAGRYQSGIRAMEELLRRNGYAVPPAGGN